MSSSRILLVDSYEDLVLVTEEQLNRYDAEIEVYKAGSEEEALEHLKNNEFDIIVSDYMQPGIDGFELMEKIEELYGPQTFVIYTVDPDLEKQTEERGASYVKKGATRNFAESIEDLLENAKKNDGNGANSFA